MEGSERLQLERPTREAALACFGTPSVRKASRAIARYCQRELQQFFSQVYQEPARSNNNVWLRKKLLEAIGGSMRYSEPTTVRRKARKPKARSPAATAPAALAAAAATAQEGLLAIAAPAAAVPLRAAEATEGEARKSSSFSTHTGGSSPRTTSANSEGTGCSPVALSAPAIMLRPVVSSGISMQQQQQQVSHYSEAQQYHDRQHLGLGSVSWKPDPGLSEAATASGGEPSSLGSWLSPAWPALHEGGAAANSSSRHPHLPPLTPLRLPLSGRNLPTPPGPQQLTAAAAGPAVGAGSSAAARLAQRQVSAGASAGSGTSSNTATPFSSLPPNLAAMLGGVSWRGQESLPAVTQGATLVTHASQWDQAAVKGFQAGASSAAALAGAPHQQPPCAGLAQLSPDLSGLYSQQAPLPAQPMAAAAGVGLGPGHASLAGPTGQLPILRQSSWPGAAWQDGSRGSALSHGTSLPVPVTLPAQMAGIRQEWRPEAGLDACGPELCLDSASAAEGAGPQWAAPLPAAEGLAEGFSGLNGELDMGSTDLPWGDADLVGSPSWPAEPSASPAGEVGSPAAHLFGCWWSFQL
ncbi:hypothetical protein N2152v2_009460 [Parachlorella kessleri]